MKLWMISSRASCALAFYELTYLGLKWQNSLSGGWEVLR
jgi:hypothetical protein